MPRIVAAIILLVAVLAIGGGIIATTAYQAGVATAVTTTAAATAAPSSPRSSSPPTGTAGAGTRFGFGFFGFLVALFFLFIVFGLIRAIVWAAAAAVGGWGGRLGRPRRLGPTTAPATDAPLGGPRHETFDDWHRQAHDDPPARRDRPTRRRPDRHGLTGRSSLSTRPRTSIVRGRIRALRWPAMKTILVVDDEPKIVQLARDYLEHAGFAVLTAADGPAGARRRSASATRTWSSSTSACPGSTASTSPASSAATRRSRSSC